MRSARGAVSLFALVVFISAGSSRAEPPRLSKLEDYFVYDALLRHVFIDNKPNAREFKTLAIGPSTVKPEVGEDYPPDWAKKARKNLLRYLKISDGRLQALIDENKGTSVLQDHFSLPAPHLLLVDPPGEPSERKGDFWKNLYRRHSDIQGIIGLSKVSYDADGRTALVYLSSMSGYTWGVGYVALMEKKWGSWKVKKLAPCWAS